MKLYDAFELKTELWTITMQTNIPFDQTKLEYKVLTHGCFYSCRNIKRFEINYKTTK